MLTFHRREGAQDPLHLRPVFRIELGLDHRLQQPFPMVLPRLLCMYDQPSRTARYSTLSEQVWRGVERV